jgi:hypothetical protein
MSPFDAAFGATFFAGFACYGLVGSRLFHPLPPLTPGPTSAIGAALSLWGHEFLPAAGANEAQP